MSKPGDSASYSAIARALNIKKEKARTELAQVENKASEVEKTHDHYRALRQVYEPDPKKSYSPDELRNMAFCRGQINNAIEQKAQELNGLKQQTVYKQHAVIKASLTKTMAQNIAERREQEGLYKKAKLEDQRLLEQHTATVYLNNLVS